VTEIPTERETLISKHCDECYRPRDPMKRLYKCADCSIYAKLLKLPEPAVPKRPAPAPLDKEFY